MKILLINPAVPNLIRESLPPVVEDESGIFPPLGLLYIAAYAEAIENCEVQVLDCQAEHMNHEDLSSVIQRAAPDIVGIQAMTFTFIDAVIVARIVRKEASEAFIVFGGPHPTIYPRQTVEIPEVDAVIPGEGELIFAQLVKFMQAGKPVESLPGVMTKTNSQLGINFEYIDDLDQLKMPARHLIDSRKYTSPLALKNPVTTMMSSRGCPARCTFCDRPQMGKKFRKKSAVNVVKEMRYCVENLKIGEIFFYDDTFTIDKKRVLDICDKILYEGLKVKWDIRARIDTVTPEMIRKLRKAGCHRIHYGVESGSEYVQRRLKKNLDLGKVKDIFLLTKSEGIEVLGYFMIGCPDETDEDMNKTFDLIMSLPMDYAHISVFTPYPGTEIYKEALETGFYDFDYWMDFASNPKPDFSPRYWNQYFTDEELMLRVKKAYGKFYSRPSYIFSRLLKIKSIDDFARKAIFGIKLLKSTLF